MRSATVLVALLLSTGALAGCVTTVPTGGDTNTTGNNTGGNQNGGNQGGGNQNGGGNTGTSSGATVSLSREVFLRLTNQTYPAMKHSGVWAIGTSVFVVEVKTGSAKAADLTIQYLDRAGSNRTRPLSDFTGAETLVPGVAVRIEDANLTSTAVLSEGGKVVAQRNLVEFGWWRAGNDPLGLKFAPGSGLTYTLDGDAEESFRLRGLKVKNTSIVVDAANLRMRFEQTGSISFDYADAAQTILANGTSHEARPLSVKVNTTFGFPLLVELAGRNGTQTIEAGFELRPSSHFDLGFDGRVWATSAGQLVRADLVGGGVSYEIDPIAWFTGNVGRGEDDFSCYGKARADACRPTEIPAGQLRNETSMEPQQDNITAEDGGDGTFRTLLGALMSEDLRPGDRLVVEVRGTSKDFEDDHHDDHHDDPHTHGGGASNTGPSEKIDLLLEIRATGFEQVTVPAGTFEALKVVHQGHLKLEAPAREGVTRGFRVDQPLLEGRMWVMKDSFVPVRIERTLPFNLSQVVKAAINSIPASAWEQTGLEPLTGEHVDVVLRATSRMELTRHHAGAKVSPWLIILGSDFLGGALGAPLGEMFNTGEPGTPGPGHGGPAPDRPATIGGAWALYSDQNYSQLAALELHEDGTATLYGCENGNLVSDDGTWTYDPETGIGVLAIPGEPDRRMEASQYGTPPYTFRDLHIGDEEWSEAPHFDPSHGCAYW